MNTAIIDAVRKRLTESIDGKVLAASAHFFKEGEQAKVYGVRMGEVSAFISLYRNFNILPRHNNIISLLIRS